MINTVIVDVDSSRKDPIIIRKPDSLPQPTTPAEAEEVIINDIECLSEALLSLIHMAIKSGYITKADSIDKLNAKITRYINDNP